MLVFRRRTIYKFSSYCRSHPYLLITGFIIVLLFITSRGPFSLLGPGRPLEITRSSYDWSIWQPHHPQGPIRPLPSLRPGKLAKIQHTPRTPSKSNIAIQNSRRDEVRRVMRKGWKNYRKYAWMRDELTPLTAGARDPFGGWGATLIDAMDTLWVMDMKEEFREAVQAAATIDWARVQGTACNLFETTIRHLGGLLSAYDLCNEPALLAKAVELGDMLYAGFDTPNYMPPFWLDFEKAKTGLLLADVRQPAATATTLSMEFTRLSQLTGDPRYYDAISRVTDCLFTSQNLTLVPGMWPTFFNLRNSTLTSDGTFTLGALSDSMYEYVLKMHLLLGTSEPRYEQMYRTAADSIIKTLLFRPMTPQNSDILFTGTFRADRGPPHLEPDGQHLACFAGGMFALGGKLFDIPEHVDIGARLTKGCIWAYNSFPTGLAPETFKLIPCESLSGCRWDEQRWLGAVEIDNAKHATLPKGFQNAFNPKYMLRPEALESVFIMYRITGDEYYRDAAWQMFLSIQRATSTEFGNAAIQDVTVTEKGSVQQLDSMESFWMAETLKYLYLIFSPVDLISLDEYVFNTECHPFRILQG